MNNINHIITLLHTHKTLSQEQAKRFFKTSKGSYGESDEFIGITVPTLRKIAKSLKDIPLDVIEQLLFSNFNEARLLAILILVKRYQINNDQIYQLYLKNLNQINNWNLVDSSAPFILGHYLFNKDRAILNKLAKSNSLWERRISIVTTLYFIRQGDPSTTFHIAKLLLDDKEDLIHKAAGWMLREAGKKDFLQLINFLEDYAPKMPRPMLRYATEKFSKEQRNVYVQRASRLSY